MDGGAPSEEQGGAPRGAESRDRLVAAAVELVLDHYRADTELREVFSFLTPGAVASRAGLSRALLYHHWSDVGNDGSDAFSAFLVEVTDHLRALSSAPEDYEALVGELPDNVTDVVRLMCDHELQRPGGLRSPLWQASQSLSLHGVVSEEAGADVIRRLAAVYEQLAGRLGLQPVAPLGFEDLAVAIASVLNGFELTVRDVPTHADRRFAWTPQTPSEHDDADWNLLAIMVESVVSRIMVPIEPPAQPEVSRNTPAESDTA